MVTDVALVGPAARVRDEVARWEDTCVTSLLVQGTPFGDQQLAGLTAVADALR